jgi:hypothetical protein
MTFDPETMTWQGNEEEVDIFEEIDEFDGSKRSFKVRILVEKSGRRCRRTNNFKRVEELQSFIDQTKTYAIHKN